MSVSLREHISEIKKYEDTYRLDKHYRMGPIRMADAQEDIMELDECGTYLDVGCGRGEMVDFAEMLGHDAMGLDAVQELCDGERIICGDIIALPFDDDSFDYVSCYDVLEHILPGMDRIALSEIRRVARKKVFLTANNKPSICRATGKTLHVNRKAYEEWDQLIRDIFERDRVKWLKGKRQYVSETWHIDIKK